MKHFTKFYYFASLLICFLFFGQYSYADGSKDLYPGGNGGRAKLRSSTSASASYPFASLNTHHVYAKAGETITMASSVMGLGNARIKLTKPDGTTTSYSGPTGLISKRVNEVAGPRLPGVVGGDYYDPILYAVPVGGDGIYSVDFVPPVGEAGTNTNGRETSGVLASVDWKVPTSSDVVIAAWDVSIYGSSNALISGRVYSNVLNLDIYNDFSATRTYYGKMYVLTKDGYIYKVDNNGNNGISFEFFVNSNGFVNGAGEPLYKSLNTSTGISSQIKDPRTADNTTSVTHKMFYTLPANDLPQSASGAVAGGTGTTWLKNPRLVPKVSDLKLFGVEGTEGQVSNKGGNIKFSANVSGRYIIEISAIAPASFPTRTITGFASAGSNSVNWDGKDGSGNPLPSGNSPAKLTVRLQGAEVHFPYFDMEINPNGIKLELLNEGLNAVESDVVFWDDTDITLTFGANNSPSNPINASQSAVPAGTSSNTNGHKWGNNSSPASGTFGDNRSMDTWTFVLGAEETLSTVISTKIADLKVNSITPNVSTVGANGNITYTVEVQNSDGSAAYSDVANAPFSFNVPAGMEIVSAVYVSACGTETNGTISADKLHYNAELTLTNGCKGTYTIVTKAVGLPSGKIIVEATIMRPNDVNDPDATNPDPNVLPTDPHLECKNGTATESCNNIKYNNVVTLINKITAVKSIVGNPATVKPGDVLTYNIILTNTDALPKTGVTVSDAVPSTLTAISAIDNGGVATGNTINWTNLTVPANGTLTLSFKATVVANLPVGTISIKNTASVIDPIDPTTPITPVVEKPTEGKITAVKSIVGDPATVKSGDVLTYNIVLTNSFGTAKTGVTASDDVPNTLTGITAISNAGTLVGNKIDWTGLTVPANGSLTLSFNATVVANLPVGTTSIKNTASILDPIDPTTPITPVVEKPTEGKITAVKTIVGNPAAVKPGDVLTYNIVLTNSFGTAKTGVTASDDVPNTLTGITAISNAGTLVGNKIDWTGLTVPANGSLTLSFNATVIANLPVGTTSIKNTASIVDPIDPAVPVKPEVEKPTEGKITAVKTIIGNPATVKPGDVLTYNITLSNSFGTAKTGVTASDNVPNTLTSISAISNSGTLTGNKIDWTGLTVPANGSLTLSFNATVVANLPVGTTSIKNTASIVDPIDPAVPVKPEVEKPTEGKITAVKTIIGNPATVKPGDVLTYNITLSNSFGTAKTGVTASDDVPNTLTSISAISNSGTLTGNKIDWTGLTVPANGSLTLSFNATVVANLPVGTTSIKNTASIVDPIDPTTPITPVVEKPTEGKITAVKTIIGNPATVKPGDVLTYNITLSNSFGTAKTGVTASDNVPNTLTSISAISNSGTLTGNKIDWTGLTVPANGSLTLSFNATVIANLPVGTTSIKNTASIVDPIDPTTPITPVVEKPTEGKITAVKTIIGNPATVKPGDVLTYNITLSNSFGTAKAGVTASDNIPNTLTSISAISNSGTLAGNKIDWTGLTVPANGTLILSFNATVVANLPAGTTSIKNVASIIDPIDPTVPVTPEVEKPTEGKITAVKTIVGNPATVKPGDVLTYNITLTNSYGTLKTGVTASDDVPATLTSINTISNGGTLTGNKIDWAGLSVPANGTLVLSFKAIVSGDLPVGTTSIKNVASIIDPIDPTVPIVPEITVPVNESPAINLVKAVTNTGTAVGGAFNVGDKIEYTFTIKNTGDVTLNNINITDPLISNSIINIPGSILPNNEIKHVANYIVTQADADAGNVTNSALVKASSPAGNIVEDKSGTTTVGDDPTITPIAQNPLLSLTKTAVVGVHNKIGDIINYNLVVKNTGNVTVTAIAITDANADPGSISPASIASLAPNATANITAKHTVTQADLDRGYVTNIAKADGKDPKGGNVHAESTDPTPIPGAPVVPGCTDCTVTPIDQTSALSLTKTAVVGVHNKIGDIINYNLVVKNTGNVTVTAIAITDANADAGSISPALIASLAPNATANITAKHTVTQADLDRGYVTNIAKADGKDPKGGNVHAESTDPTPIPGAPVVPGCTDCTVTPIDQTSALSLTKTAVVGVHNKIGDIINYNLVVKNTGNVTVTAIAITDANADAGSISPALIASLAPNATANITAKHTVTQADLDRGYVTNIAKADGKDPKGGNVHAESTDPTPIPGAPVVPGCTDCTVTPIDQTSALSLTKTAVVGVHNKIGDVINYNLVVKNTGNVTVTAIAITDANADAGSISPASIASLAPNATANITAKHTVTQADLDRGYVTNIAKADGKDPKGGNVHAESTDPTPIPGAPVVPGCTDCTVTPIDQTSALSLTKTSVVGVHNKIGDIINYNLVVKNTGNVTVTAIAITDANADAGSISPASIASLAPNATANITAKHTVTQADLDRGYVTNIAKADGKDPKGGNVHAESTDPTPIPGAPVVPGCTDCTVTPIDQTSALSLTKTAVVGVHNKIGDIINYNLVVKNTGNVTVTAIAITDANADPGSISPASIASLAPNATANITAKHTVTQADLDRGYVTNIAKADGKDPKGGNVHAESTDPTPIPGAPVDPACPKCTITPIDQKGAVALVKTVTNAGTGENGAFVLGNQIEYTFTVTNIGNVSLKDLVLSDPLLNKAAISIPGILAPGKSVSHVEKYTITAVDIAAGKVTNQAVINATDPKGANVKDQSGTDANNDNPTVITIAKPPVVKDDTKETQQNKPVMIDVQKNDEPGNSDIVPGSTTIITQPKNGTVKVNTDGTVTYTPNPGYTGTDEFTYTVTDKNGQISNPAKVTLTVVPTKPVAIDDTAEIQWNTEVKIPVLGNDKTDAAAFDKGTLEITEQPKHGTVKVNPDGTVTYLPNSGYTGTDTFKYRVKDEYGNWTDIATATITVKGFFIPNVITPNGDGKNDSFVIVGLENYNNADVTIFNRWGNEVYRNNNYKNTWTGEGLNEGTYYYLIRLNSSGKQEVYKGWVLIKR